MSIEQLRKELFELAEKKRRLEHLNALLAQCVREETALAEKTALLKAELEKEQADVERLEKGSLAAAALSLFGKKEQRIEKEQAEAQAAKVKYQAALNQRQDCAFRIKKLTEEVSALSTAPEEYERVYRAAEAALADDPEVLRLTARLGELSAQSREVDEAVTAGESCLAGIDAIMESLDSAESWGTWDLIGGGFISAAIKHEHLDEAEWAAHELQASLSRFAAELSDVELGDAGSISVEGFLRFADYFFDGIFADWAVLSHIERSRESVEQVQHRVDRLMEELARRKACLEEENTEVRAALKKLILGI